jgi:hypothetical protein
MNLIPAPTEDEQRYVEIFNEPYAISVCGNREVEGANFVAHERVGSTLQDDNRRAEGRCESRGSSMPSARGEVLAMSLSSICPLARTGEERAVGLVKGRREDAIG